MTSTVTAPVSKKRLWAGRIVSAVPALLLLFSAIMKFTGAAEVSTEMGRLGYPASHTIKLGILELACTILYIIPRTAVLGAILLAAYLGGATATHVRIGDPFFMPPLLGVVIWLGLYLRDYRVADLIPLRK